MKKMLILVGAVCALSVLAPALAQAQAQPDFDRYFVDKTLRVDYFHVGDSRKEIITLDRVYEQGIWAGSRLNLIDPFDNGRYAVKVIDPQTGRLIFCRGFDSYFGEYRTTDEAQKGIQRAFHESALIPCPKSKVQLVLESRDRDNALHPLFSTEVDPAGQSIIREPLIGGVQVFELQKSGDPHRKVDVAFIAEGYTRAEEGKLRSDLDRFLRVFFSAEPYRSHREAFNIYGVFKPSEESGCDEPSHGVFKRTALSATFDSLGSERYLLTEDNKSLRDIAAHVPYDTLTIMVNHKRYGGGGIYNLFCTFTVDNQWYEYLVLHEFGHSFGGLADEYYTSDVAYNEFYPKGVEPKEANITALLDPAHPKWKDILTAGIAVPTPWEKEAFDTMDTGYQQVRRELNARIARMKRDKAPEADIARLEEESERLSRQNAEKVDDFLRQSQFAGTVGVFEGAGYASRGLYRPMLDCLMFTKGNKPLCKVCEAAVARVIRFFSE
ncbi:MAG: IgA Peptidase M64 [Candidatus Aminicenantes bacterium]|nr:IgA Peptidase M64 [Candidatus Aminicenantes bacterium]